MAAKQTDKKLPAQAAADSWFTAGRFAAILAGLIFVCFPLVILGVETFFYRDFGGFSYPLAFFYRESFWHGQLPLWNPYSSCGLPFLAQWNTLTLYPLSLIYLIFPLSWSLGMFCLLHLFFGGLGMYFLAQRWTANRFAAAAGGLMFAFNGLTWQALMWPNNIAALGWMPWLIWAAERGWRGGARAVIVAGLLGALQMLTGAPEVIMLTWVLLGILWLAELIRNKSGRGQIALRFILISVLVAGLAAVQLLPFLDLLGHSQRSTNFGTSAWSMPASGWINYIAPLFHAFPQKGVFSQYEQFWTASYYLGVGTVMLALMAVWRVRDGRVRVLTGLAIFSLVMALGDHGGLYPLLKKATPVLGFMRFPIKFVILGTFVIPLLAALGLAWFQSLTEEEWARERKKMLWLGGIVLVAMALAGCWEWVSPMNQDDRVATIRNTIARGVFLVGILFCLVHLRGVEELKLQRLVRLSLLLLFWFDIFTHTANMSPTVEREVYDPDSVREFFKEKEFIGGDQDLRPGISRAMPTFNAMSTVHFHAVTNHADDVNGRRLALYANFNLLDHAAKMEGFFSLNLRQMDDLTQQIYSHTNDLPALEDFMGVQLISNPTNSVGWVTRKTFLPFITGGQEPVFSDDTIAVRAVMSAGFEPKRFVVLEPGTEHEVKSHHADVKITSPEIQANQLSADVSASTNAMVVVAQAFYHRWQAYVDDRPVRLWRANYAFQALEVPAGSHKIRIVYEDAPLKIGGIISLATLALAAGAWGWQRKKQI